MTETRTRMIEETGSAKAGWAFGLVGAAVGFGLFGSGAPLQLTHGVLGVLIGAAMLFAAPRVALPRLWWVLGAAVILLAALAFLPRGWGYDPDWRREVEALGLSTGGHITAHPAVSFQHWVRLALTVAAGIWLLGHRLTDRGQAWLMMGLAWAIGIYAALSVALVDQVPGWVWDPEKTFGLFANRSHTATLLVIGVLAALTTAVHHIRYNRGGRAALVLIPGMLSAGALLGFSVSRAGLLLLGLGVVAWVAGVAAHGWSRRATLGLSLGVGAVGALFWISDAEIKSRLLRPAAATTVATPDPPADGLADASAAPAPMELDLGLQEDGRWLIFRDTFDLIREAWWSGIGRGMFEHVIPQYRRLSACESRCLHPESDWLLLATEAGVPCALALAGLVAAVALAAARSAWRRRGWSLRWGGLVTALVVPVHGVFDTPGHLPVLSLLTVMLAAAAFRMPGATPPPAGPAARLSLRVAGAIALAGGSWLLVSHVTGGRPSPIVAAPQAMAKATRLYIEDQAAVRAAAAAATTTAPDTAASIPNLPEDLLRAAIAATETGLRSAPLDATLHYQRGMLALHFDDLDAVADQAFAIHRRLDPMPPGVPLRQSRGWLAVDPARAANLWVDALHRAEETARVSRWIHPGVATVTNDIVSQARTSEPLMRRVLTLFQDDHDRLRSWAAAARPTLLDAEMPRVIESASPADRAALLDIWKKRGSRAAVEAYEAPIPDGGR
ncbi:MAG: O-antigen ligase family protein [Verrucomicrobiales bacterium]